MPHENSVRNFEENLAELNTLVTQLESSQLPLEEALKAFEKGVKLSQDCQSILKQAKQKVQILLDTQEGEYLAPFDSETDS